MSKPRSVNFKEYVETELASHIATEQVRPGSDYGVSVNSFGLVIAHVMKPHLKSHPNIRFESTFLGTPGLNAYADEYRGSYILAMHTDLFQSISAFAHACFASDTCFRDIGEPNYPGVKKNDVRWSMANVGEPETTIISPCPERRAAVNALTHLMTRIVWLHEFAHCHNRHIRLLRKRNISRRMSEAPAPLGIVGFPNEETYREQANLFQSLEADADHWAMQTSLWLQFQGLEPIKAIAAMEPKTRVGLTLFAIASVCWILDQCSKRFDDPHHPSSDLRQSLMVVHLSRFTRNERPDAKDLLIDIYKQLGRVRDIVPEFYELGDMLKLIRSGEMNNALLEKDAELARLRASLSKTS